MKLDFTLDELGVLDKAIQQMPYYIAAPLINKINTQLQEQKKEMDIPIDLEE